MQIIKLEVILSQAIEEDLVQAIENFSGVNGNKIRYTKFADVTGRGYSSPKLGDAVWPQFNSAFFIFCSADECEYLLEAIDKLRRVYPDEGLACFKSKAEEV
ncbi:MAG: hypothetical protein Ta2A_05960 [Treponemataceae bacterium]|nr:MAG: hypothetical protein Ta2A_05960 [Treponemataceae bacterium]